LRVRVSVRVCVRVPVCRPKFGVNKKPRIRVRFSKRDFRRDSMALPDESMAGAAARPPLGEPPLGELSLNGMQLDDGALGIMQVETAAGVEMLGGEPGVAQHLAAHVVDDAGCVQMAATVRAASIERVDALDS